MVNKLFQVKDKEACNPLNGQNNTRPFGWASKITSVLEYSQFGGALGKYEAKIKLEIFSPIFAITRAYMLVY